MPSLLFKNTLWFSWLLLSLCIVPLQLSAEVNAGPMNNQKLEQIISRLGGEFEGKDGYWLVPAADMVATVITDENADRMRIMVPIIPADALPPDLLYRVLQANFDTALDARYAIAQGQLWSTFIHPLRDLSEDGFVSGFAQTLTLAKSFGGNFSSGLIRFRGGDSQAAEEEFFRQLIEQFYKDATI